MVTLKQTDRASRATAYCEEAELLADLSGRGLNRPMRPPRRLSLAPSTSRSVRHLAASDDAA